MPSPFPGMNPYLEHEDAWHNFHTMFPTAAVIQLTPLVGTGYYLKTDENVYIHELPEGERRLLGRPDVFVGQRQTGPTAGSLAVGGTLTAAPQRLRLPAVDVERVPFVEIRDRRNHRLVTVIELLSPANKKPGGDRLMYESKRAALLARPTHFVEIDLLRGWRRMPPAEQGAGDYGVLVSRSQDRPAVDWYSIGLREPIPTILIPLEPDTPPVPFDLQAVIHGLYDGCGYDRFMYETEPDPLLKPEDAAWARGVLAGVGISA
jgi:hypothetical protein